MEKISILINTCDRSRILKRCLESLLRADFPKNKLEILVLDDASRDDTITVLTEYREKFAAAGFVSFSFYKNEKKKHIAWGRFFLSSKIPADSDLVLYMDDDVFIRSETLRVLSERITKDKSIGIIGPRIVYYRFPGRTAHCANFIGKWSGIYREADSGDEIFCDWLNSSCFLVRKEALERSGGFSPDFYVSHQEVDFCLRVKKAGFSVLYYPRAEVSHDIAPGVKKRERLYYVYRNKILVIKRNMPFPGRLTALSLILFFGLPKYLLESAAARHGINLEEIKMIFKAVFHGFSGKAGKI